MKVHGNRLSILDTPCQRVSSALGHVSWLRFYVLQSAGIGKSLLRGFDTS